MTGGNLVSDGLLRQIHAVIRHYIRSSGVVEAVVQRMPARIPTAFKTQRIIFDEDLAAVSDPLAILDVEIDTTIPNATVCDWSANDRRWKQTDQRLHVLNFADEDYDRDDTAWAIPQAGMFIAGGCPVPVSDRPEPPWWPEGEDWPPEDAS